jgi:hypothetical protein
MQMSPSSGDALKPQSSEFLVYPNRRRTMVWLLLGGVSSGLLFLGGLVVLLLMLFVAEMRTAGAIFLALLLLGLGGVGYWPTRVLADLLTSGEPMLVITHQGVRVGKLYGSFDMVLPWEEIAAIYLHSDGIQKQLCIRPTDVLGFLSRFSPFMRFFLRINLMNGAPIAINQSFLDQPIRDILQQLHQRYGQEVEAHQVLLQPFHSE